MKSFLNMDKLDQVSGGVDGFVLNNISNRYGIEKDVAQNVIMALESRGELLTDSNIKKELGNM